MTIDNWQSTTTVINVISFRIFNIECCGFDYIYSMYVKRTPFPIINHASHFGSKIPSIHGTEALHIVIRIMNVFVHYYYIFIWTECYQCHNEEMPEFILNSIQKIENRQVHGSFQWWRYRCSCFHCAAIGKLQYFIISMTNRRATAKKKCHECVQCCISRCIAWIQCKLVSIQIHPGIFAIFFRIQHCNFHISNSDFHNGEKKYLIILFDQPMGIGCFVYFLLLLYAWHHGEYDIARKKE